MIRAILCAGVLAAAALGTVAASAAPNDARTANQLTKEDRDFFEDAAQGGLFEVKLGQVVVKQGASEDVKQFAQRMIDDHSRANQELSRLAAKKQMPMPTAIETRDQALYDKLAKLEGAKFDDAYMDAMRKDHDQVVADFRKQASDGQDPDLQKFAQKTLPTLEEHDRMARDLASGRGEMMNAPMRPNYRR